MKRFLSMLTVFVLALSLAIPVGAVEYNGVNLPSINSVWNDKVTNPYAVIVSQNGNYKLYLTGSELYVFTNASGYKHLKAESPVLIYEVNSGKWEKTGDANRLSLDLASYDLVWTSADIYDNGSLYFATTEVEESACDGSSCPATDVNIDGICDDCGMMLMSLSRSPVDPDVTGNNKNYVMFYSGTVYQYTAYTSDSSYTIRGEEYGSRYRTYLEPAVTATRFHSYDGINWEQTYNGTTANDYPGEIGWELISSTYDWYTEEGDRFFPVPLWEEVQTVTQGEMGTLTSETAGTMRTLVVCGVGLMACLMALSLFGKRWLLFLR